jgi:hypothetical protein
VRPILTGLELNASTLSVLSIKKKAVVEKDLKLNAKTKLAQFERLRTLSTDAFAGRQFDTNDLLNLALQGFVDEHFHHAWDISKQCTTIGEFWDRMASEFYDKWFDDDTKYHFHFRELTQFLQTTARHQDHVEMYLKLQQFKEKHIEDASIALREGKSDDWKAGWEAHANATCEFETRDVIMSCSGEKNLDKLRIRMPRDQDFTTMPKSELITKLNETIEERSRATHGFRMVRKSDDKLDQDLSGLN